MENRVLLAFVLSLLVFVGWGYFLEEVQPPKEKIALVDKPSMKATPALPPPVPAPTLPVPNAPATAPLPTQETPKPVTPTKQPELPGEEVLVNVFNGRANMVFSSRGGTLRKIILPEYKDDNGEIVNLVEHNEANKWPLSLESSNDGISYILQNGYYEVSASSLTLTESIPTGSLTFHLKHESGLEVIREYTFTFDSFMMEVKTQILPGPYAANNFQYSVLWGPSLGGKVQSQTDMFVFSGPTTFVNNERVETPAEDVASVVHHTGNVQWTAFQNKYFAAALIPISSIKSTLVQNVDGQLYVGLDFESVQSAVTATHLVYAGTKQLQVLEGSGHKLFRLLDYGWFGNKVAFLVKPLLKTLEFFHGITGNYGWSIIFLTVIIKLLFSPLTHKSFKSMKGMQKVQPYVKLIQERNKGDRQKINEEMIELYKKHKVNPLGGCLPMLLQIPVFIALYHALFFSIELRGAPFMGWITDLSVSDPYYVTPVLMGATMFFQQRLSPSIGDPVQQKIMMFLPIVFTFLFLSFPAGLVIYWTVNNILTISQQYYIYKIAKD
ncbi:Inner membrane protein translocase and chaperone YidC, long form [hydrothermal vent metagenome]|uniref:Membrane protein insertase YidC n=1 Tax=hydrothermal vent metagenome TaxID=652676 RepID=A0A3B1CDG4_9ZZZZ